jgi:hypothetical protein
VDGLLPEDERAGVLIGNAVAHAIADGEPRSLRAYADPGFNGNPEHHSCPICDTARITDPARIEWLHPGRESGMVG